MRSLSFYTNLIFPPLLTHTAGEARRVHTTHGHLTACERCSLFLTRGGLARRERRPVVHESLALAGSPLARLSFGAQQSNDNDALDAGSTGDDEVMLEAPKKKKLKPSKKKHGAKEKSHKIRDKAAQSS